mmetsp:Transcript_7919/g.16546  ORF Transcript_7919/g.16546 Transcript_7919/m.16546 type:complete len:1261 (+) Transcript_7919:363-4145(+)
MKLTRHYLFWWCLFGTCRHLAQANLLSEPQLTLNRDAQEAIEEENGIAIKSDNSKAFVTTRSGSLLEVPVVDPSPESQNQPFIINKFWVPPSQPGITETTCASSVVLVDDRYAVYAVVDDGVSSRIFIVDTEGQDDTRTLTIDEGTVNGTPLYSAATGHLYVVHNFEGNRGPTGKVSIFEFASGDEAHSVPTGRAARDVVELTAPTMTTVTLDNGNTVDWIVVGEMIEGGANNRGSLYGIRFDPTSNNGEALWHRLARNFGSLLKAPAVSQDGRTIVVGGFRNTVTGWIDSDDLESVLNSDEELEEDINPTFETRISNRNAFITTTPLLVQDSTHQFALVPNTNQDLFSVTLDDQGTSARFMDTFDPHVTPPLVSRSRETGEILAIYDVEELGMLRQVAPDGTVNYRANCQGFIADDAEQPARTTRNNCNEVSANMALSPRGDFVVYAGKTGVITAMKVGEFETDAPTAVPTNSPSVTPTAAPSVQPTAAPSTTPTASPSKSPMVTDYPTYNPTTGPTRSPTEATTDDDDDDNSGNEGDDDDDDDDSGGSQGDDDDDDGGDTGGNQGDDDDDDGGDTGGSQGDDDDDGGDTGGSQGDDDDDDDGGNQGGDDDDDDANGGGTSVDGLGAGVPTTDSDNSKLIVIILAVVATALVCCIFATVFLMRRSKETKQQEAKKQQEEVKAKRTWMSNKEIYEEEMRMEEEETMNALAAALPDDEPQEQPIVQSKTLRSNRRRRHHDRSRISSMSSLGSISESDCEDDLRYQNAGVAESGFEIALEEMENGQGSSPTASTKSSPSGSPSRSDFSSPASKQRDTAIVGDFIPATLASKRLTHPPMSSTVEADPVIVPRSAEDTTSPNHDKWFAEVLAVRSKSLNRTNAQGNASGTYSQAKSQQEVANPEPSDTDEGDDTTSKLSEPGRIRLKSPAQDPIGTLTPKRDRFDSEDIPMRTPGKLGTRSPDPPGSPMSPSDVLSIDSSLYLEGSTLSPGGTTSLLSGGNNAQTSTVRRGLSPPGGGSILSGLASAKSVHDDEDEELQKITPGAHYLMPSLSPRGQVPRQEETAAQRSPSPAPRSPTSNPTSFHRPSVAAEEYEELDSQRGATTYSSTAPAQFPQSRAGLFSRRERPVERLLAPDESGSVASDADSVEQQQRNAQRYAQQNQQKLLDQKPPRKVGSVRYSKTNPTTAKPGSKDSGSQVSDSSYSRNSETKTTDVWNSFLSELSKAEEQFFNPQASSKARRSAPPTMSVDSDEEEIPPPPPDEY